MRVYLSLGSNEGCRRANLTAAIQALDAQDKVRVTARSRWYETEPVGKTDQPLFLNMAVEIETDLEPLELLHAIKAIEREGGRRPSDRWGPRPIDIDIVLWGDHVMDCEELTLPHKEFRRRAFVLVPLAEIAPETVDPVSGLTVAELAAQPEAQGTVVCYAELDH